MLKYFILQCKRTARLVVWVALVMAVLLAALFAVRTAVGELRAGRWEDRPITVGLCGELDGQLMKLALSVLENMDELRFSLEVRELSEAEARRLLLRGDISAYLVVPDDFIKDAMYGMIHTIRFVTAGGGGLIDLFKTEVAAVAEEIVSVSEKGIYGLAALMQAEGLPDINAHLDALSVKYVLLVLARANTYEVEVLGLPGGLALPDYLTCGLGAFALMLSSLTLAPALTRGDEALARLLSSRGVGGAKQALSDFVAAAFALIIVVLAVAAAGLALGKGAALAIYAVPLALLSASSAVLVFEAARDLISGALLHFLLTTAMALVSGCLYPVYFLPDAAQDISGLLPSGAARLWLAGGITGERDLLSLALVLVYTCLFAALACALRERRLRYGRGESA